MFTINENNLKEQMKLTGVCNLSFFEGECVTCSFSKDGMPCKNKKEFNISFWRKVFNKIKLRKKICKNWQLSSDILNCFKYQKNGMVVNKDNKFKSK